MLRKGIDHDEVKPWQWATIVGQASPVEIVSYPDPTDNTIVVRMAPGDPTSVQTVPLRAIACFAPDRHEWFARKRHHYSDNPTAYIFVD